MSKSLRRISTLTLALFIANILPCQSAAQNFRPLVRLDASWYIGRWVSWGPPPMYNVYAGKYFIADDTLIDSIKYHFVYGTTTDTLNFYENKSDAHLIREDSNGRVFIRYHKINTHAIPHATEILLYDFSMLPGDTITYLNLQHPTNYSSCARDTTICVLIKIDTVFVSGVPLRRYQFERNANPPNSFWYEGIGSIDLGSFGPFCDNFEGGEFFGCYFDSSIYLNHSKINPYCSYLGAAPSEEPIESQLFPNPVNDRLYVRMGATFKSSYAIYDTNGDLVRSGNLIDNDEIEFSSFRPGIYLVQIFTDDKQQRNFKVLKE